MAICGKNWIFHAYVSLLEGTGNEHPNFYGWRISLLKENPKPTQPILVNQLCHGNLLIKDGNFASEPKWIFAHTGDYRGKTQVANIKNWNSTLNWKYKKIQDLSTKQWSSPTKIHQSWVAPWFPPLEPLANLQWFAKDLKWLILLCFFVSTLVCLASCHKSPQCQWEKLRLFFGHASVSS